MKTEQFFRCLADNVRVKIILILWQEGELSTVALAQLLSTNENTVRRHMVLLNKHQIVLFRQKELFQYYRINPDLPVWMAKIIKHAWRGNKKAVEDILQSKRSNGLKGQKNLEQKYSA